MFILPIVFMGVFAIAFGGSSNLITLKTGIYIDKELPSSLPNFADILKKVDDESDSLKISTSNYSDVNKLKDDIKSGTINTGLVISKSSNPQIPFEINIIGKENNLEFQQNKGILNEIMYSVIYDSSSSVIKSEVLNNGTISKSPFNFLAPGLIIYGLLILIPGIAQSFAVITEKNYIFRFANSKAKSVHIILGTVIYYLIVTIVQVLILYLTAVAFGYKASGNIFAAFVPAFLTGLFVIGVGLLIGSFVKKTDAATNIGTIVSIIFGFFSGSFIYGIGSVLEFNLFGRTIQFNDLLPSKWGTTAIEKILSQNLGLQDIGFELAVLAISGIAFIGIGILVYQKRQLGVRE
jgi:ABC-type multidrug transport system permease subunit